MKKKILFLITVFIGIMFFEAGVYAKGDLMAYTLRTEKKIVLLKADIPDGAAVAAVYSPDNRLFSAQRADFKNKEAAVSLAFPNTDHTVKLYYEIGTDKYLSLNSMEERYLPGEKQDIPEEKEDSTKTGDASGTDDNNTYPSFYSDPKIQDGTIGVIKKAEKTLNENGDIKISLDLYYMGKQTTIRLDEDFDVFPSDMFLSLAPMKADELSEGDAVRIYTNLNGERILKIELLFCAPYDDPVTGSDEIKKAFKKIEYGDDGLAFGLVRDVKKYISLYDPSGLEREALYIDIEPDTVVYCYDAEKRSNKLSLGGVGDIEPSEIPSQSIDENDNIIDWEKGASHNYAFVRMYEGVAYEIVFYKGYVGR